MDNDQLLIIPIMIDISSLVSIQSINIAGIIKLSVKGREEVISYVK